MKIKELSPYTKELLEAKHIYRTYLQALHDYIYTKLHPTTPNNRLKTLQDFLLRKHKVLVFNSTAKYIHLKL